MIEGMREKMLCAECLYEFEVSVYSDYDGDREAQDTEGHIYRMRLEDDRQCPRCEEGILEPQR